MNVKYPDVTVKLSDTNGNAFAVMGTVSKALAGAGVTGTEINVFLAEAMGGSYDNLLVTCMRWVDVS